VRPRQGRQRCGGVAVQRWDAYPSRGPTPTTPLSDLTETLRDALADRYVVERELGRGGMATVFLAQDLKHRRRVAIKVLHADIAAAIGPDRFLREIEIAAQLQHPHILPLYDSGEAAGYLYYVMPFVEGESLRDRLDREKQLPQEDVLKITNEVASALGYAHSHDIVHRDIKPENIMLSGGSAVVADFGIARAASAVDQQQLTQTGTVIGTPLYMSPEQGTGSDIDGRSDQYSLACVVYEMLVGEPPFTGPNVQSIIARHSMATVSPPSIVRASIPETMERALLRALDKVPADRFPTVIMFAEALARPSGITAAVQRQTGTMARPAGGVPLWRRRLWWAVPVVMLLAVGAWGAARLLRGRAAVPGAVGGVDPTNIAVRYFDDLSRDSSLGYLADGLTEGLIDRLSGVSALHVISKSGVAAFRGSGVTPDSLARALAVGSVIQGSVEPAGHDSVRVSVRLTDGFTGADIVRQTFQESTRDPLKLRDELATKVADFLRQRLGQEVRLRELRAGTSNPNAWLLAEQAEKMRKDAEAALTVDGDSADRKFHTADSLLAAAEAADPRWVEPIVQRGQIALRRSRLMGSYAEAEPDITRGLDFANQALQLESGNPPALELRGTLRYWKWLLHGEPDPRRAATLLSDAEGDLREAVKRDPSLVAAWSALSHLDYQKSDVIQAKLDATSAYSADAYYAGARDVLWRLFTSSYDLGQFPDAKNWCQEGERRFPKYDRFTQCQIWMLSVPTVVNPDVAEAWRLLGRLEALTPKEQWPFSKLDAQIAVAAVLARAGRVDSARHVLDRSQGNGDVDPTGDLLYSEAFVRTILKDKDRAFELLKRYIAGNEERRAALAKDYQWWFQDLRSDPRYQQLIGSTR
jgi:eukaryotic-like serine/threonine-protein kinase